MWGAPNPIADVLIYQEAVRYALQIALALSQKREPRCAFSCAISL